jgi:hypothetical protein
MALRRCCAASVHGCAGSSRFSGVIRFYAQALTGRHDAASYITGSAVTAALLNHILPQVSRNFFTKPEVSL